ncbi:MAG: hypothetical protein WC003_14800 [Terrimicrobiaceae bacterium]
MKNLLVLSAAIALALIPATSLALDEIRMLPTPVKLASTRGNTKSNTNVESKDIAYSVKVTSSSFKELTDVTVKYNIFYEVVELGSTGEPDIQCRSGSHTIPSLLTNKAVEFETDPIKLEKASLDAGWYFANGASARARDKVVGVWFKAFDSAGKQIGEYTNPSSVATKRKWKDQP